MEQYISKSAVLAEIERRIENLYPKGGQGMVVTKILKDHYEDLFSFINALEVKEVDLEKELNDWRHNHFHGRRDKEASGEYLERTSQLNLAKHFYELGMVVSNKAQKGENI